MKVDVDPQSRSEELRDHLLLLQSQENSRGCSSGSLVVLFEKLKIFSHHKLSLFNKKNKRQNIMLFVLAVVVVVICPPFKFHVFLVCQQMSLKCHQWLSLSYHFSQHVFPLMRLFREWNVHLGTDSTTCGHCSHIKQGFLCHQIITFRAMIWCLGFIRHTDEKHKALHPYFLCQREKKHQVCLLTTNLFNKAISFQGEIGLAPWTERHVLWLPSIHILLWASFWKMGNSQGQWKVIQMAFIFYRKATKKTSPKEMKEQDRPEIIYRTSP